MFPTLLGCVISMKLLKSFDEPVPPRRLKESCLMTCFKPWQKKYNFGQIVHLGRSPQIYTRHKKIMSNLISRSSLIIFGNSSRYTGPICKTCLIFYGTFKSHESHCNTHIFKCYRRPVTECSLCMHSYNHIYHYESIACLGVSIPFFTNAIFSVWHRKYRIFFVKIWISAMLQSLFWYLSLVWGT